jgi:hypothetical protein
MRGITAAALACGLVAVMPSAASAQLDARWQPWVGCWQPAAAPQASGASLNSPRSTNTGNTSLVCVIPTIGSDASSSVSVVTIADGKVVARDTISATGQNVARSKDGCTGVESANWSADGHRVYVSSDFTCPGNLKRTSSGIFAISPNGEWVNVQGVNTAGNKGVRTLRYADAGIPSTLPSEVAQALRSDGSLAVSTARAAAGAPLTTASVVDASRKADPAVVEAWIIDRGQSFGLDARQVVALADAGVPGNVTDAMVAVSYPNAFAVAQPSDDASGAAAIEAVGGASGSGIERSNGRDIQVMMMPSYSRYGYSPFDYYGYGYSPFGYSPYGYSPYGYSPYGRYYSPYGAFGTYGAYGAYGGLYSPPIIVLKGSQSTRPAGGYVVKGRGYTQTAPRRTGSSSSAESRPTVSSPPPASTSNNSQPSQPSQPASSGRTAHPRP